MTRRRGGDGRRSRRRQGPRETRPAHRSAAGRETGVAGVGDGAIKIILRTVRAQERFCRLRTSSSAALCDGGDSAGGAAAV